jgi:choline kinase
MKAVILVAGVASRLRPLTNNTPKCLLIVGRQAILGRMIDNLTACGVDKFVIVTGYLEDQIQQFFKEEYANLNVTFIYNEIYDSTNNIYSLWLTKDEVAGQSFLLLDGDILFDKKIVDRLMIQGGQSSLALRSNGHVGEEDMKVMVNENGFVVEINKSMNPAKAAGESIGIELFSAETSKVLFTELQVMMEDEKKVDVWYEEAFQRIIDAGSKIAAVDVGALQCMELDTIEDFRQAEGLDL